EGASMIGIMILAVLLQGPRKLDVDESKILPPLIVPAGTAIPISLTSRVSSKNAKDGDGIYGKTIFPITADNKIVIPAGPNVRGKIVERSEERRVGKK